MEVALEKEKGEKRKTVLNTLNRPCKKKTIVGFHTIPSDEQRRKAWLERIRHINVPPLQYSYVCSDRFSASCYQSNLQSKITGHRYKRRLKEDAVPSIFDYASQSNTKRPRLSSENRRDRRMH